MRRGPVVEWRRPVGGGYGGISVARGRAFVMDRQTKPAERERIVALDAACGNVLWVHEYPVRYGNLDYGNGPRATPTVLDGRVYTLGAVGHLCCLDAETGRLLWSKDLVGKFGAQAPTWGLAASPIVFEDLLIVHAGLPRGSLTAFDRQSGDERWRALDDPAGYATPILIQRPWGTQLIAWTPLHVTALDPRTGKLDWEIPYAVNFGVSIAMPVLHENTIVVSGYWEGTKAIRLGPDRSDAELLWEENRNLRGLMSQPLARAGFGYLLDKQHGLTCFEIETGKKRWDDDHQATPRARSPQATFVWLLEQDDRALTLNADGELLLVRMTPKAFEELARFKLIPPTEKSLIWAYPAYAGQHVYARSDEEIVCARLPVERTVNPRAAP